MATDVRPGNTIQITRDTSFGSTNDVLIDNIGSIAVDDLGRVYFTSGVSNGIHIFESDGHYLKQIGRKGRGPGEFTAAYPALYIISTRVYAIDLLAYRANVFSVDSLRLIRTVNINPTTNIKSLADNYIHQVIPVKDGTFLVSLKKFLHEVPELSEGTKIDNLYQRYYPMDKDGRLIPKQVFKIQDQPVVTESIYQEVFPVSLHFFSKPLVAISDEGAVYVANSKDFLIKEYSLDGEYQRAFFHPFQNVSLNRKTALESSYDTMNNMRKFLSGEGKRDNMIQSLINISQRTIRQIDLPSSWPALDNMMIDDENRLWISTIVEDFDIYEWWVLEETGELITRFEWPRDEPIEVVKNGYMYTRETDEVTGLQQVVRYRVEMTEAE